MDWPTSASEDAIHVDQDWVFQRKSEAPSARIWLVTHLLAHAFLRHQHCYYILSSHANGLVPSCKFADTNAHALNCMLRGSALLHPTWLSDKKTVLVVVSNLSGQVGSTVALWR